MTSERGSEGQAAGCNGLHEGIHVSRGPGEAREGGPPLGRWKTAALAGHGRSGGRRLTGEMHTTPTALYVHDMLNVGNNPLFIL